MGFVEGAYIMMDIFVASDNILSPLGDTTAANILALREGISGIVLKNDISRSPEKFYASLFPDDHQVFTDEKLHDYTKFEKLLIASIKEALKESRISIKDEKTVLVISSTKGNIQLLEKEVMNSKLVERISLASSAARLAQYFEHPNKPVVVSNACISGMAALLYARRMILSGSYDHAVVAGADLISRFVLSGFESLQAMSTSPCKPFDVDRNGISLGEAASTIILTKSKSSGADEIILASGCISNDSNHISGPSTTGKELAWAINKSLDLSNLTAEQIDFISAHGTGTIYNDDMEAKAFALCGLAHKPINSLKGYFGHTLGAAGLIESVVTVQSMKKNLIFPTFGFRKRRIPMDINVCDTLKEVSLTNCLKTGSGFGGCNAVLVFKKQ